MKSILFAIVLFSASTITWASDPVLKSCTASINDHNVQLQQIDKDIQITLEDINLGKHRDIEINKEKFKVSGKEISVIFIESLELSVFMKSPLSVEEIFSSMMYGRPEYDAEADMVLYYASKFVSNLICK
ncbi:MAG: hypothetical protein H7281_08035 [Bacteriovorax sp.]|nr:hypothetical protein [Bacteriovorax sp.]